MPPGKTTTVGAGTSSKVASAVRPSMPFSLRTSPGAWPTKTMSKFGMRWRTS